MPEKYRHKREQSANNYAADVYSRECWELGAALSWVIWRDAARITVIEDYAQWRSVWGQQVRYDADGLNAVAAWRQLLGALQRGELCNVRGGQRQDPVDWAGIDYDGRGIQNDTHGVQVAFNRRPLFPRTDILRLWPALPLVTPMADAKPTFDGVSLPSEKIEKTKAADLKGTRGKWPAIVPWLQTRFHGKPVPSPALANRQDLVEDAVKEIPALRKTCSWDTMDTAIKEYNASKRDPK